MAKPTAIHWPVPADAWLVALEEEHAALCERYERGKDERFKARAAQVQEQIGEIRGKAKRS